MPHKIEYFYSTHSAYAYLGSKRLMEICAAYDCQLVHRPFNLSPVVEHSGGQPFAGRSQAHVDYFFGREIERWAAFRDVPIIDFRPTYHDNPLQLSSGVVIAADHLGLDTNAIAQALLQAHWRDDIDLANSAHLSKAISEIDIDPAPLLQAALTSEVQAVFAKNTKTARDLNLFGSPTYILNGDPYYGQDHLELLEYALQKPFPKSQFKNPAVDSA